MSWIDERLLAFDCETTGTDIETDRIVSAALVEVGAGRPVSARTWLIACGIEIPPEVADIHGITNEKARTEGAEPAASIREIAQSLVDRLSLPVCVFRAPFDLSMLDRELRRYGHGALDASRLRVVDPLVLDRHLDRYRAGKRNLVALCEHYRVELAAPHEAGSDAISTARLAWRIAKSGRVIREPRSLAEAEDHERLQEEWERVRDDLGALHEAQVRWYRQQAVGLRKYFARGNEKKGVPPQPDRIVEDDWPLRPFRTVQLALGT